MGGEGGRGTGAGEEGRGEGKGEGVRGKGMRGQVKGVERLELIDFYNFYLRSHNIINK